MLNHENHGRPARSARRRRSNSTLQMIQALEEQSPESRRDVTKLATSVSTASLTSDDQTLEDVSCNLVTIEDSNDCSDDDTFASAALVSPNFSSGSDLLAIKDDEPLEIAIVTPELNLKSGGRRRRRMISETPVAQQEDDLSSQILAMALEAEAAFATRHVKKNEFAQFMDEFENRHKKDTCPRSTPVKELTSWQESPKKVVVRDDIANTRTIDDPLSIILDKRHVDAPRSRDMPGLRRVSNDSLASLSSDSLASGYPPSTGSSWPSTNRNEVWSDMIIAPFR